MSDLVVRLVVLVFSVIQGLLGLRLLLGFIEPPAELVRYVPTLVSVTDVLIAPFVGLADMLGIEIADLGPAESVGGGAFDRVDVSVVIALVGWSLIELVVLMVLRVAARAATG